MGEAQEGPQTEKANTAKGCLRAENPSCDGAWLWHHSSHRRHQHVSAQLSIIRQRGASSAFPPNASPSLTLFFLSPVAL